MKNCHHSTCLSVGLPPCLPAYTVHECLPAYLFVFLSVNLPACLFIFLAA